MNLFFSYVKEDFTQIQLKGGWSLIAQLADASFVIIDGGNYDAEDAGRLYDFMKGRSAEGQKPVIAMWLFTHMHCDHTDLAGQFLQEYAGLVDIKAFAYQFQDCKTITILENAENSLAMSTTLVQNMKTYYPDTVVYTLHTGQTYYFKGMEMEILRTTVMILGDCSHEPCRNLACTYGDYLKSDILQLAHHGLIGGDKKLYQLIDPEICFRATNESRFKGELAGQVYQWCIGEGGLDYNTWIRDPQVRERQHYHNSVTTTINLE